MSHHKPGGQGAATDFDRLRKKAEELLRQKPLAAEGSSDDLLELIYNLQMYQAEVEIQNEELRQTQEELSKLHRLFADLYEHAPCGYLNLNRQGTIIRCNVAAGALLAADTRTRIRQLSFIRCLDPQSENAYLAALGAAAMTGDRQGLELRLSGGRGAQRWVWAEIVAEKVPSSGKIAGYRMALVDISERKESERLLLESEQKYHQLFDDMICGALLLEVVEGDASGRPDDVRIVEVNKGITTVTGIAAEKALGSGLDQLWPDSGAVWREAVEQAMTGGRPIEVDHYHEELGRHLLMSFFQQAEGRRIGVTILDITETRKTERSLGSVCRDLEAVVRERSDELLRKSDELEQEVKDHTATRQKLEEKSAELQSRMTELGEANAALQALLKARDSERTSLEEQVVCNINELVRPHLHKLAEGRLSDRQLALLEALDRSLGQITSPLSRRFILESSRLTPIETQVAELIRQGKSTKEIASLMGVADSTVNYHRLNIRNRLGLNKKRVNLQSYLKSLG